MSANSEKSLQDRFIPSRILQNFDESHHQLTRGEDEEPWTTCLYACLECVNILEQTKKKEKYKEELWKTLFGRPPTRVLNFSETRNAPQATSEIKYLWPVKPRKKPQICRPKSMCFMPYYPYNLRDNIADWGRKGYLAHVSLNSITLWNPETGEAKSKTNLHGNINKNLKWSPDGSKFALSLLDDGYTFIGTDNRSGTECEEKFCGCGDCSVQTFGWLKDGGILVGCTQGTLTHLNADLMIDGVYIHDNISIIKISVSAQGTYCAILGVEGNLKICRVDNLYTPLVKFDGVCQVFAWHSWKDKLMAIGQVDGSITIFNVETKKIVGKDSPVEDFSLDALSFSPVTGELVASYYCRTLPHNKKNIIRVMSTLNRTVDGFRWHKGRVQYLLWSPDGRQLATVGADRLMCIWDFNGEPEKKEQDKGKKKKKPKSDDLLQLASSRFGSIR